MELEGSLNATMVRVREKGQPRRPSLCCGIFWRVETSESLDHRVCFSLGRGLSPSLPRKTGGCEGPWWGLAELVGLVVLVASEEGAREARRRRLKSRERTLQDLGLSGRKREKTNS